MSILQGVRASNIKQQKPRFVIKSKPSVKQHRQDFDYQTVTALDQDAQLFIEYMINKSHRLKQLLQKKNIFNQSKFFQKHLFGSICLKTMLKQILDKMMADRRLGRNLKGMNKSNLVEVENAIWTTIQRQASLYNNDLQYQKQRKQFETDLQHRKQQLKEQIERLTSARERRDSEDCPQEEVNV